RTEPRCGRFSAAPTRRWPTGTPPRQIVWRACRSWQHPPTDSVRPYTTPKHSLLQGVSIQTETRCEDSNPGLACAEAASVLRCSAAPGRNVRVSSYGEGGRGFASRRPQARSSVVERLCPSHHHDRRARASSVDHCVCPDGLERARGDRLQRVEVL